MREVYVDNNATTRVAPEVLEEMLPYFCDLYGNPSSVHRFGGKVGEKVREARERVADLLQAHPDEIVFTSCGTESDNAAIRGTLASYPEKRHIVTTKVEHPAVLNLCRYLEGKGYEVTYLSVDNKGMVDLDELREAITDDTALVSIMYANNETGVIFPIEEVGEIVKQRGIVFHCDAVQAVGKISTDMRSSTIDLLSLSGHKLHAPKGIGALYMRRGVGFVPYFIGGHQEGGRRGGTENVPSIVGLGKACVLAKETMAEEQQRIEALRDRLEKRILERVPGVLINGHRARRLPNTTNMSFEAVEGEAVLLMLSEEGIAASSGSACSSGEPEPSHVLMSMGVPYAAIHGTVRFSLGRYNTEEEIDYILEKLPPIIQRLREISPDWSEGKRAAG
ncbi:MAG: cysteine desulfurase NifS [Deltaproteobacteria bacterium]|nr:cysteine desulfurase NifS [Deltaproteobacteria bacterium]